ncbi:MAG: tyrosine--tRNA ligase [Candidatus Andersenbacteria bacterium]
MERTVSTNRAAVPDLAAIEVAAIHDAERDLTSLSADEQLSLIQQHADAIVTAPELGKRLAESKKSGKPLRIKFGIDPTAAELHLGHAVPLRVLRLLQRMGHKIVLIFGDFTATIGDPSGRSKERPVLTAAQVKANVRRYEQQAALFVDVGKAEVRFNREWHAKLKMDELFSYLRLQTVAQAMEREDFRERAKTRAGVTRAELLYATLQAIDSVKVGADVEVGGRDQLLNLLEGRELMSRLTLTPQTVVTFPLLPGTGGTGAKMSKSAANFIPVSAGAAEVYGAVMAVADKDLPTYLRLLTDVDAKGRNILDHALKTRSLNPKQIKQLVARLVTRLIHPNDRRGCCCRGRLGANLLSPRGPDYCSDRHPRPQKS